MRLPDGIADRLVPRLLERAKRQPLTHKVVGDHEIIGVTPEMITQSSRIFSICIRWKANPISTANYW